MLGSAALNDAAAQLFSFHPFRKPVKLALVLPLNSNSQEPARDCMDFYSGALMAIDAKKAEGVSVKLKVVDLSATSFTGDAFAQAIDGYDAVIGPFAAADLKKVLPQCRLAGVPLVSPLDQKAGEIAESEPLFFQVPTPHYIQAANLVESIPVEEGGRVTVFHSPEEEQFCTQVTKALEEFGIPYKKISYNVQRGRVITDSLKRAMKANENNYVIIASESEAFASDVVRNMSLVKKSCPGLSVYVSNKVRNFETIDADLLYKLGASLSTGYFVDYKDTATQNFILKYRALYHTEPSQYAFSGYDIFYFFISAINDLQGAFREFVPYYTLNLLQSNILFRRISDEGGYVNIRTRDVEYQNDFSIEVR
ncbi:MAG: amino acid ABC transporter substrate-binding protein [Bacteroidales bacterium]|nr:amino acid ABC transporter substrate-binding protein [Bacteroidales bacterium]